MMNKVSSGSNTLTSKYGHSLRKGSRISELKFQQLSACNHIIYFTGPNYVSQRQTQTLKIEEKRQPKRKKSCIQYMLYQSSLNRMLLMQEHKYNESITNN